MQIRRFVARKFLYIGLGLLALAPPALEAKKEFTTLRVLVQDGEGEPVARASVIVRTLKGKKKRKIRASYELKTSLQGTAPLPPLRRGLVLIQVIAPGYQTYAERVELTDLEQTTTVTLSPPKQQHSVHAASKP